MTVAPITNILTNPSLVNLSQNTAARVSCETGLKAIGRPSFILIDKDVDAKTKGYSAMKEFLYQAICLGVYLAVIPLVFKRGMFALAKHGIFKNTKGFEHFKNSSDFMNYRKLASMDLEEREKLFLGKFDGTGIAPKKLKSAKKKFDKNVLMMRKFDGRLVLRNQLIAEKNPEKFDMLYGTVEAGSYIGSILGLAILAPEIGHHLIHPIMRAIGIEKKPEKVADAKSVDANA